MTASIDLNVHTRRRPRVRPRVLAHPTHDRVPRPVSQHGNPRGKTSSWILVATVITAFAAGGIAMITGTWILFAACAAIIVAAIPAGAAIHIMSDTVGWEAALPPHIAPGNIVVSATEIHNRRQERTRLRDAA
ncbi:hypothetical protein [Actinocorallia longicatena]|uniref:Uncharacterized protein n=1 Tax=Actinocorallia longicatena TaxID=111803 RepID=A0ABP6Q0W2_9ACTN